MITPAIQKLEGLSDAEVARLEKMLDEIESSNRSMVPEIWKPDATIELDSSYGGQSLSAELFSKDQLKELSRLGKRLASLRSRKDKRSNATFAQAQEEAYAILKDYVEFHRADQLWEIDIIKGRWMAHLTMPGYMDQTEPVSYRSLKEAIEGLHEMYADIIAEEGDDEAIEGE